MKIVRSFVLFCALAACGGVALAHPGHGLPGWIHPHLADLGLLALAGVVLSGLRWFVKKLLAGRR